MFFDQCQNLNQLKAEYKRLVMIYHPDRPTGDEETMKTINGEYDRVFTVLRELQNIEAEQPESGTRATTETPEEFRAVVNALLRIDGIEVELCGSWLWISGDTYQNRDALKVCGCLWSHSKKRWYWRHAEDDCWWSRGKTSMHEIRTKYGSEWLERSDDRQVLPA